MSEQPEVHVVFITAPNVECAETLARALVEDRLVACVNVVPGIRSFYRWEGEVQSDPEVLLIAKTRAEHRSARELAIGVTSGLLCKSSSLQ